MENSFINTKDLLEELTIILQSQPILLLSPEQYDLLSAFKIVPVQKPTTYMGKFIVNPKKE
jgi:hypothetical protein